MDALAALTAHIPEQGQQIVRYCGYYSNKARGQRRKKREGTAAVAVVSCLPEPEQDDFRRHCKRAWARLIRKVYLDDPLTCPKCAGQLRIIENPSVIEKIPRHLKLWDRPKRPPPPRASRTLDYDADFLAAEPTSRRFDGID